MTGFLSYDLAQAFALKRNTTIDFPFLKENGELLSIARAQGFLIEPRVTELYKTFYKTATRFVQLYPQYYRFILGMVIDLEDLGMEGNVGREICTIIRENNFLMFDTSDLRRLEALHLLGRGLALTQAETNAQDALKSRLRSFTRNKANFFKFNRPLFYELTHLVFFLTDYGRNRTVNFPNLTECLHAVGFLSVLDDDADLLSEVIIALNFLGENVPAYWQSLVVEKHAEIEISFEANFTSTLNFSVDDYHVYFVLNWCLSTLGKHAFTAKFNSRTPNFKYSQSGETLLSKISQRTHAQIMGGYSARQSNTPFKEQLSPQERLKFNSAMDSTPIAEICLRGLSNEVLSYAA